MNSDTAYQNSFCSILFSLRRILLILLAPFSIAFSQEYILLGWNDLGMHCANKDFSKIAVLPPYNNINAQLIRKVPNQLPQLVTAGYTVEYSIPYNTYSVGKTNFWTYAQQLFGLSQPLPQNIGLAGKGLTGVLDTSGSFFHAVGIPITPLTDTNLVQEQPYQLIHLVAKAEGSSTILATTDVVIPVSNEIGCVQTGCHASQDAILLQHENVPGFNRIGPVLCASCHASNALGTTGDPNARPFSYRMHQEHSNISPPNAIETCYKCHPGPNTQCFRDVMRTGIPTPLVCQNCHGTLSVIAQSISNGRRPWLDEPQCGNVLCHGSNFAEEPGKLFRQSTGHGGMSCSACHGSPHAILPTIQPNDNLQSIRLQGHAGVLRDCLVCHANAPTAPGPHGTLFSGANLVNDQRPKDFNLYQNYPNPFNPETEILFDLPRRSRVTLEVFNALGQRMSQLVDADLESGSHSVRWNAAGCASGLYYYRIHTNAFIATKKMLVVR